MKRIVVLVAVAVVAAGCTTAQSGGTTPPPGVLAAGTSSSAVPAPGSCHMRTEHNQPLPDLRCTPGAINPDVTPADIASTICKSGWTATIRPPAAYTDKLKREQIAAYGYSDTNPRSYEEDHLVSLELGGAPSDPRNLWPEPGASPNPKDEVEGKLKKAICFGKVTLSAAQKAIATDWTTALAVTGAG